MDIHIYANPSGQAAEALVTIKAKIAELISELQESGWTFDSTMIDGEPANLQEPEEASEAIAAADEAESEETMGEDTGPV